MEQIGKSVKLYVLLFNYKLTITNQYWQTNPTFKYLRGGDVRVTQLKCSVNKIIVPL